MIIDYTNDKGVDQVVTSGKDTRSLDDLVQINYSTMGADDVPVRSKSNAHVSGVHNVPKAMPKTTTNVHACDVFGVQASEVHTTHANTTNAYTYNDVVKRSNVYTIFTIVCV